MPKTLNQHLQDLQRRAQAAAQILATMYPAGSDVLIRLQPNQAEPTEAVVVGHRVETLASASASEANATLHVEFNRTGARRFVNVSRLVTEPAPTPAEA